MIPLSASYLRLVSGVNFNDTYEHTRWFSNITEQKNYFESLTSVLTITDASFIRKENVFSVRVNRHIDELNSVNYMYFNNPSHNNKRFYAFVTSMEFIQQNVTAVYFTVDVIQSFMFDISFKKSFIVREHQKRWNSDGSPVINRIPENLDYGDSYENVLIEDFGWDIAFLVVQMKSDFTDNSIKSSWCGIPQPLMNIVYPFRLDGANLPASVDGNTTMFYNPSDLLNTLYTNPETVNNVVQIYVTDRAGLNCSYDGTTLSINSSGSIGANYSIMVIDGIDVVHVEQQRLSSTNTHNNGNKYKAFNVTESKLLMHPYSLITLTDFKGNMIDLKLENINSQNLDVEIVGSLGSSNKVSYNVKRYSNSSSEKFSNLENALINESANDVPIISDYTSAFIQGNMNSVKTKALSTSILGSVDFLNKSFQGVVDTASRNETIEVGSAFTSALVTSSSLLKQQSKLHDIQNVPPSLNKQGGNSHFEYGFNIHNCYILHKTIKPEYIDRLTAYFEVYGYKVNRFGVPNIHTRESWNYIELEKPNITGNIHTDYLNTIKIIFQRGITLWHTNDVLNYSLSNNEI